jgi:hypothetical protein
MAGALLGAVAPASAAAADPPSDEPIMGKWERLAPDWFAPAPENSFHEIRVFRRAGDEWVSTFKYQHDPFLGTLTPPDMRDQLGEFQGVEVDVSTVDCRPSVCPADIAFVLRGQSTFGRLTDDPIIAPTHFVITESGMAWWIVYLDFSPTTSLGRAARGTETSTQPSLRTQTSHWGCIEGVDEPIGGVIDFEFLPEEKNCTDSYDNDGDGDIDGDDPDCAPNG